jgi:hypothetical protein
MSHEEKRLKIYNIAETRIFQDKGGSNIKSINKVDLEKMFDLYDKIFFHNAIRKKLGKDTLRFIVSNKDTTTTSKCTREGCVYTFQIAPIVIATIFENNPRGTGTALGVGCKNILSCLQLVIEHEIVHLLMIIWGYLRMGDTVYGEHGTLFSCASKEFFGHTRYDHDFGLAKIEGTYVPQEGGYRYQNNSCYIDSLLTVLFENVSSVWRDEILRTDVRDVPYVVEDICDKSSALKKTEDVVELAEKVQSQIRSDLKDIRSHGHILYCAPLRQLLVTCLPSMKTRGGWVMYNPAATYDLLANLFPGIKMMLPFETKLDGVVSITVKVLSSVTMWDFMEEVDTTSYYSRVLWSDIQSPILVFQNTLTPRVRHLDRVGKEMTRTQVTLGGDVHVREVTKVRSFGYTILNERYILVGVISLAGVSANTEGGSHYTAYFLSESGKWVYYNDLSSKREVDELPRRGVWIEAGGQLPELYFYVRKDLIF